MYIVQMGAGPDTGYHTADSYLYYFFIYCRFLHHALTSNYFWRMYRWVMGAVQHIFVLFLYILRIFTALTSDYFWRMHRWVMGLVLGTVQHVLPNFQLIILERN